MVTEASGQVREATIGEIVEAIFDVCQGQSDIELIPNKHDLENIDLPYRELPRYEKISLNLTISRFSSIKFTKINGDKPSYIITFELKPESNEFGLRPKSKEDETIKFHFKVNNEVERITYLTEILKKRIPNEIESNLVRKARIQPVDMPNVQWAGDNWLSLRNGKKTYGEIYEEIHQSIIDKLNDCIPENKNNITIIDIGAGSGNLAKKAIQSVLEKYTNIQLMYLLLEPNRSQCSKASETLDQLTKDYGDRLLVKIIPCRLEVFSKKYPDAFAYFYNKIDIVISSGGPLNYQIVSWLTAKQNLKIVHRLLAAQGRALITGISPTLLTKKDFETVGLLKKGNTESTNTSLSDYIKPNLFSISTPKHSIIRDHLIQTLFQNDLFFRSKNPNLKSKPIIIIPKKAVTTAGLEGCIPLSEYLENEKQTSGCQNRFLVIPLRSTSGEWVLLLLHIDDNNTLCHAGFIRPQSPRGIDDELGYELIANITATYPGYTSNLDQYAPEFKISRLHAKQIANLAKLLIEDVFYNDGRLSTIASFTMLETYTPML